MSFEVGNEPSVCPRCGANFVCMVNDVANCHCSTLIIAAEVREQINSTYNGCLCNGCLRELSQRPQSVPKP